MIGDCDDVKRVLSRALRGPGFVQAIQQQVAQNGDGFWPQLPVFVYQEERLSHLTFPMAELIVYRTVYADSEIVKAAKHDIGVRWTAVARDEATVTKYVEILVQATTQMFWNSTLDTQVQSGPIIVGEEDYSPLVPARDHPYVKAGLVRMTVPVWGV